MPVKKKPIVIPRKTSRLASKGRVALISGVFYEISFTLFCLRLFISLSSSKMGNLLTLLGFDDDYTDYKQMCFRDCVRVDIHS